MCTCAVFFSLGEGFALLFDFEWGASALVFLEFFLGVTAALLLVLAAALCERKLYNRFDCLVSILALIALRTSRNFGFVFFTGEGVGKKSESESVYSALAVRSIIFCID